MIPAIAFVLIGWLLLVAGTTWLLGPWALVAGGAALLAFGFFAVRVTSP